MACQPQRIRNAKAILVEEHLQYYLTHSLQDKESMYISQEKFKQSENIIDHWAKGLIPANISSTKKYLIAQLDWFVMILCHIVCYLMPNLVFTYILNT